MGDKNEMGDSVLNDSPSGNVTKIQLMEKKVF